jgi:hypothetical protein
MKYAWYNPLIFQGTDGMHNSDPGHRELDDAIISCLSYFDVFNYPMKLREIHSYLPRIPVSEHLIKQRLHSTPLSDYVSYFNEYYFFNDRPESIVRQRERNESFAAGRWKVASFMSRIIGIFPFVRGVMISGELSKNISHRNSDIDYFIVTSPDRMWIARTLLIIFKKIFLLNGKKYFCINYFRTNDNIIFDRRYDFYLAVELITLRPLFNPAVYREIIAKNSWLSEFFPNYPINRSTAGKVKKQSNIQYILEKVLSVINLVSLDIRLMRFMKDVWRRRYPHLNEQELEERFITKRSESSTFPEESYDIIMDTYRRRYAHIRQHIFPETAPYQLHPIKKTLRKESISL